MTKYVNKKIIIQAKEPRTNNLLSITAQVCSISGCKTRIPKVCFPKEANHF